MDATVSDAGAVAATVLTNLAGATTGDHVGWCDVDHWHCGRGAGGLDSAQLVSLDAMDATVSDAGAVAATVLTNLAGATTGDITSAGMTSITGLRPRRRRH